MATIQRRASGSRQHYRVQIRLKGHLPESATFERLGDAREWARLTEAAIREHRHFRGAEARRRTVADLIDRYLAEVAPGLRGREPETRQWQLAFWRRELGPLLLADLTPAAIASARSRLRCGPATCNRYLAALSHAVSFAVREWDWLNEHPVRRVKRAREPKGRMRFLSEEERARLLTACRTSASLYALVVLALSTGARKGELLRLCWRDVDLLGRRALIPQTKSGKPRTVPLVPAAVEALRRLMRQVGEDRVFLHSHRRQWEEARAAAGLAGVPFHALRHTAASYLAMSGASVRDIQSILGHETLAMAQRYAHLTDDHLGAVADRMAERFLPDA